MYKHVCERSLKNIYIYVCVCVIYIWMIKVLIYGQKVLYEYIYMDQDFLNIYSKL
jgi:hypothetical protein